MWIIAKYKFNQLNILKKKFIEILGSDTEFYVPKIKCQKLISRKFKTIEKVVLEGYLFCFNSKFGNTNALISLQNSKGLSYFLNGYKNNQEEINFFIKRCKKFEDEDGFLTQDFFDYKNFKKGQFITGPFTNFVFDIISRTTKEIKISVGNFETTISKNSSFLYRPI